MMKILRIFSVLSLFGILILVIKGKRVNGDPTYLGCYKDDKPRAISRHYFLKSTILTVEKCVYYCRKNGWKYAGLQAASYCFCGITDSYAKYGKLPDSACNSKCAGNRREFCGGAMKNSVYRTAKYLGCYKDERVRAMGNRYLVYSTSQTIEKCIAYCRKHGYKYAGLQAAYYCFCGKTDSYAKYGKLPSSACNYKCGGKKSEFCGGSMKNSVYRTDLYLGCYQDGWPRAMGYKYLTYSKSQTIEKCIAYCRNHRYKYAGLQGALYCFCGNTDSYAKYGKLSNSACNYKCGGKKSEFCGGSMKNSVYGTGL